MSSTLSISVVTVKCFWLRLLFVCGSQQHVTHKCTADADQLCVLHLDTSNICAGAQNLTQTCPSPARCKSSLSHHAAIYRYITAVHPAI
jgi:hypothetical protein